MRKNKRLDNHVYIYLDNRKPGAWKYKDWTFLYQPFYVGRGIDERFRDHVLPRNLKGTSYKTRLINKIKRVCGENPFHFKIYEDFSYEESVLTEEGLISHFGRRCDKSGILLNITKGERDMPPGFSPAKGGRKNVYRYQPRSKRINQFSLDGELIKTWENLAELRRGYFGNRKSAEPWIRKCCLGEKDGYEGYVWKYEGSSPHSPPIKRPGNRREVFQYLKGVFVRKYNSVKEAGLSTDLKVPAICSCCRSPENRSAGGYQWFYDFQGDRIPYDRSKFGNPRIVVEVYDDNQNFLRSYKSVVLLVKNEDLSIYSRGQILLKLRVGFSNNGLFYRREDYEDFINPPKLSD